MMRSPTASPASAVEEIQGLYGAFSFPEKLLQKIWLRGDFDRAGAITSDGRSIRVGHPGKWNLLGGPDFRSARLRLGDATAAEISGDVELHLRAADWDTHGHANDPAYDQVVLHVVLFPPEPGHVTLGAAGRIIPVLVLLPLLHRALEEFAADEAVEGLANRPFSRLPDELGPLPAAELSALLARHATARWRQKVHFAGLRLQRLGWEAACHHGALEILGQRFNRAPMLRIAGQWPLREWQDARVAPSVVYTEENDGWSLQGVRPANHPRVRLGQYAAWEKARPDWPGAMRSLTYELPTVGEGQTTRDVRRAHRFRPLRAQISTEVCGGGIGGSRLDTFICDGLLPLLAADTGRDLSVIWHHWFAGDLPPLITGGLRQLGFFDGREQPACHGAAQGLLGWLLEHEPGAR